MSYQSQMQAFAKYSAEAVKILVERNSELFLSIDEASAIPEVSALIRLRAVSLQTPASPEDMCAIFESVLGELLFSWKIQLKPYGLSSVGREEFTRLTAPYVQVAPPVEAIIPPDEFADIVRDNEQLSATELKLKLVHSDYRALYERAIEAGRI
jgi:hypothetical protein